MARGPWLDIINISTILENKEVPLASSFRRKLGNGESIKFWTDNWVGDFKLCDRFLRLFALETSK